jgi:hypothetical protein
MSELLNSGGAGSAVSAPLSPTVLEIVKYELDELKLPG